MFVDFCIGIEKVSVDFCICIQKVSVDFFSMRYLIPILDVETKVDVKVLVMVVVKYAVWLPGLPPLALEGNARVIDDPMVIDVQQHQAVRRWNTQPKPELSYSQRTY